MKTEKVLLLVNMLGFMMIGMFDMAFERAKESGELEINI